VEHQEGTGQGIFAWRAAPFPWARASAVDLGIAGYGNRNLLHPHSEGFLEALVMDMASTTDNSTLLDVS
jgi:hypothetical protein